MPTPTLRVLLVDDNQDAVDAIAMLLESEGHEIRTANDGVTALREAQAWLPDVAILDIGLPGMNGYEVAQALRKSSAIDPQPLLIALSGYGGDRDRQLAKVAGFDHHVVKPAEPDLLFSLLASRAAQKTE